MFESIDKVAPVIASPAIKNVEGGSWVVGELPQPSAFQGCARRAKSDDAPVPVQHRKVSKSVNKFSQLRMKSKLSK